MVCRNFLATVLLLFSSPAWADLGEAEVIQLAKRTDPLVVVAESAVSYREAQQVDVGAHPNPTLGYEREQWVERRAPDETEQALVLSVPIELSGSRTSRLRLGHAEVASAQAEVAKTRSDAVVRALESYYALLYQRERIAIEGRALERLLEAMRVVARRRAEGTIAGYDEVRLEIELELVRSEVRESQALGVRYEAALRALLNIDAAGAIGGKLALNPGLQLVRPGAPLDAAPLPRSVLLTQKSLHELDRAVEAAGNHWLPTVVFSAGPRLASGMERRYGYVAGLSLELPLFSQNRALEAEARARHGLLQARLNAGERRRAQDRQDAALAYRLLVEEIERFDTALGERVQRLERALMSGYREGERSVTELVEGRRARTATELRRAALLHAAKRAEIRLRAAHGEFE